MSAPDDLQAVVRRLLELLPELTIVLLFGSHASGLADDFSDYDLLVLVPNGVEPARRKGVEEQLRAEFPSFRLDLVIGSERGLLASLRYEPTRPFWLENGIALWGRRPAVENHPPLARGALLSHLNLVEAELGVARTAEDDHACCRIGLDALEHLVQIEHALAGDYRNESIRQTLTHLIGDESYHSVRDSAMCRRILRVAQNKLRTLRQRVSAMPENESDYLWRERWQRREPRNVGTNSSTGNGSTGNKSTSEPANPLNC